MRPRRGAAVGRALNRRHFHTVRELSLTRSPNIPRSGSVARHESCRKLRSPSHVLSLSTRIHKRVEVKSAYHNTTTSPMILIDSAKESLMDVLGKSHTKEDGGRSSRPVRNRRYTRRSLVAGQRPQKRLFTPEIKRYLKDWLVRRRENPYPNREEKKHLAQETGLTYIQICNWFANWRRKLKNVNMDRNQQTWGHLIRTYNDLAQGNVEQFSICSDDSIWSEQENASLNDSLEMMEARYTDSPDTTDNQREGSDASSCRDKCEGFNNNVEETRKETKSISSPLLLSKWLESAARFQPSETNYSCWADGRRRKVDKTDGKVQRLATTRAVQHDKDEVEAAVALTTLAGATSRRTAP